MENPEYGVVGVTRNLSDTGDVPTGTDFFEFPLDQAKSPLEQLEEYDGDVPLIVSWSSQASTNGELTAEDSIRRSLEFDSVEMVDVNIGLLEQQPSLDTILDSTDVGVIVSYTNPDNTPLLDELKYHIEECADQGDIAKITTYAKSTGDSLNLLEALNTTSTSGMRVTGYCRGDAGRHTRVMSVFYGSEFCYGAVDSGEGDADSSKIELEKLLDTLESVVHGDDDVEVGDASRANFPESPLDPG